MSCRVLLSLCYMVAWTHMVFSLRIIGPAWATMVSIFEGVLKRLALVLIFVSFIFIGSGGAIIILNVGTNL